MTYLRAQWRALVHALGGVFVLTVLAAAEVAVRVKRAVTP